MPASTVALQVSSDHPVPIAIPSGSQGTIAVATGSSTVFYADNPQVSAASNQGSILAGASATFTTAEMWLKATGTASVTLAITAVAAAGSVAQFQRMVVIGDSAPLAGPLAGVGYANRIAGKLGCEMVPASQGGGTLTMSPGTGPPVQGAGWTNVTTLLTKQWAALSGVTGQNKDLPLSDLFLLGHTLINDGWKFSANVSDTAVMAPIAMLFETAFCRCGRFYPDTDTSFTYPTGTWVAGGAGDGVGGQGATSHIVNATGVASFQHVTPSDFRGGRLFMLASGNRGTAGQGTTFTFTVNGSAVPGTLSTAAAQYGMTNNAYSPAIWISPVLAPGVNTILGSTAAAGSNNGFNFTFTLFGGGYEAPIPPTVMIARYPTSWTGAGFATSGVTHSPVTDAEMTTMWNATIGSVFSNFPDGNVKLIQAEQSLRNALTTGQTYAQYTVDGIHASPFAGEIIARDVYNALGGQQPISYYAFPWYRSVNAASVSNTATSAASYIGCDPAFNTNWSAVAGDTPAITMDRNRRVRLKGAVTKSIAGVANEIIFPIPPGYTPASTKVFAITDRAGVVSRVQIVPNAGQGTADVQWLAGTATNTLDLSLIEYDADG